MKELLNLVLTFRDERNWGQFHNAKDLSISLLLEASELLENFQWKTNDEAIEKNQGKMKEEMADVMIYLLLLSEKLGIDLKSEVLSKLEKNKEKYPISTSYGSNKKYNEI